MLTRKFLPTQNIQVTDPNKPDAAPPESLLYPAKDWLSYCTKWINDHNKNFSEINPRRWFLCKNRSGVFIARLAFKGEKVA